MAEEPPQYETKSYYITYRSVYGGEERTLPPIVGAWDEYRRRQPLTTTYMTRTGEYVGTRLRFRGTDGLPYFAFAYPDESRLRGVIDGIWLKNSRGINLQEILRKSDAILLVTESD